MLLFDDQLVSRHFGQAASQYDMAANIQQDMIEQALSMLASPAISPNTIVDIGCGTGNAFPGLSARFPDSHKLGIDIAQPMLVIAQQKNHDWHTVCAHMSLLPVKDDYTDLVFSTAALQWTNDTTDTLAEWYRILKPGGYLCLGTFGEKTLSELKNAFNSVDQQPHVHTFISKVALQRILYKTGFVVIDEIYENKKTHHFTFFEILRHLQSIGATLATSDRRMTLTGKHRFEQASVFYEQYRELAGLPVSWEMILMLLQKPVK